MVDNRTNTIVSPAPLFDHGNSLFNFAGADAWANEAALEEYIETLYPSVYDDFLGTAKAVLTPELREKLRHLLNFKFKKHSRYNLPENRIADGGAAGAAKSAKVIGTVKNKHGYWK